MYHHHILSRDNSEIIKKVYLKQKEDACKGDWIHLIRKDFSLLEEDLNEDQISNTPKDVYKKWVKEKVKTAVFKEYLKLKEESKKKLKDLHYEEFAIQPYLTSNEISIEQKQLLFSLRSKCFSAKMNFKKMNKGNLGCRFHCDSEETQNHIFENCQPIKAWVSEPVKLNDIYGSLEDQIKAIQTLSKIDNVRKVMIEDILPGGLGARTHVNT